MCPAADACGCTPPAGALLWLAVNTHAASRHHYENVHQFRAIIKPGWLPFSTGIDLTDIQVAQPRLPPHLDTLMALVVAHSLIRVQFVSTPLNDDGMHVNIYMKHQNTHG